ncbi:MAG: PcfJ domain-containing protein [Sulfurovum sp.]|nr:PcfJ domain-containing protein [Sulfurovum sp.]
MYKAKTTSQDKWKNSWYIKTGFVHNFICRCGQVDRYFHIPSTVYHPSHFCSQCGRGAYLDSVVFLNNEKVSRWLYFYWDYEKHKNESGWHVTATTKIPVFDYTIQKIVFTKISIATVTLYFSGRISYETHHQGITRKYVFNNSNKITVIATILKSKLWEELYPFILSSPLDKIRWIEAGSLQECNKFEKIEVLGFFLEHDYLQEIDFFFWDNFTLFEREAKKHPDIEKMLQFIFNNRKEKSIKRAYYESYQKAIVNRYNPKADYIFARVIKDRNFMLQFIEMDPKIKNELFGEININNIYSFFNFLRQHYSERNITKIWTGITPDMVSHNIVRDTIRMFVSETTEALLEENFVKPKADFKSIHDEFVRLSHLQHFVLSDKIKFEYSYQDLKTQVEMDRFSYFLPMTVHILSIWARKLHNCMLSYTYAIHKRQSIIYGVFVDHQLTYAIEIIGDKMVQASGVGNKSISKDDRKIIDRWFREVYLISHFEMDE